MKADFQASSGIVHGLVFARSKPIENRRSDPAAGGPGAPVSNRL